MRTQVQSKAGEGSGGLRWQFGSTHLQSLGSARAARSVVVVPTPTDPMGIYKSTQDFKAPGAVKEHTNKVRGGSRDPGVKRPGAGLGLSPARSKIFRTAMHANLPSFCRLNCILSFRDPNFFERVHLEWTYSQVPSRVCYSSGVSPSVCVI